MTELETLIRESLQSRSDSVVLARTSLRSRRARSFAPLLAAAVVLVVAVATALVVTHRSSGETHPAAGSAAFVGYSWRLVSVTDALGTLPVAASLDTTLSFSPDGEIVGSDTVNGLSGTYRVTDAGYSVSDVATTFVAYVGGDRDRQRIITAVNVCFYTYVGSTGEPHASVGASVDGDTLTLTAKGFHLTYQRLGAKQDDPAPSQTSTSVAAAIVGYKWRVTSIKDDAGTLAVAASADAYVEFPSSTSIDGSDTQNGFQGTMRLTTDGFVTSDMIVGGVGSTRTSRVVQGVDSLMSGIVRASLDGDTLTLVAGGTTVTLTRAGSVVPDTAVPSATSSS